MLPEPLPKIVKQPKFVKKKSISSPKRLKYTPTQERLAGLLIVNALDIYFMLIYFMQFAKKNDYLLATDTHIRNKYLK